MKDLKIDLQARSLEKNRQFLKLLYCSEIEGVRKWFDILDASASWARKKDEGMTLGRYLKFPRFSLVTLQIQDGRIRYGALHDDAENRGHYLFIECPYSEKNWDTVSRLFEKIYGKAPEAAAVTTQ